MFLRSLVFGDKILLRPALRSLYNSATTKQRFASVPPRMDESDFKTEISVQQKKLATTMIECKMDEILACHTDDIRVLVEGARMVHGKKDLKAHFECTWEYLGKIGKVDTTIIDGVLNASTQDATLVTTDAIYDKEGHFMMTNRSIEVWKKVDGRWLLKWVSCTSEPTPAK